MSMPKEVLDAGKWDALDIIVDHAANQVEHFDHFSKVVSTHLWNTPLNHLPTHCKGNPFIVGYGDCLGCAPGVCCNFLGILYRMVLLFGSTVDGRNLFNQTLKKNGINYQLISCPYRIHVWYICLRLVDFYSKSR